MSAKGERKGFIVWKMKSFPSPKTIFNKNGTSEEIFLEQNWQLTQMKALNDICQEVVVKKSGLGSEKSASCNCWCSHHHSRKGWLHGHHFIIFFMPFFLSILIELTYLRLSHTFSLARHLCLSHSLVIFNSPSNIRQKPPYDPKL